VGGVGGKIDRACILRPVKRRFFIIYVSHRPNKCAENIYILYLLSSSQQPKKNILWYKKYWKSILLPMVPFKLRLWFRVSCAIS